MSGGDLPRGAPIFKGRSTAFSQGRLARDERPHPARSFNCINCIE
jgi:hypothetical protein